MTQFPERRLITFACVLLGVASLGGCKSKTDVSAKERHTESSSTTGSASSDGESFDSAPDAEQDPCTFLSTSEAARYVGALATPPYRASDEHASTSGDACTYRGKDGRTLEVKGRSDGGDAASNAIDRIREGMGAASAKVPDLDTLANRVLAPVAPGPWDKATWIPGGSLFVTKGDAMVVVDVTGMSGKEGDAIEIARVIAPRIGHPLDYDGAKAVALVPKPPAHPDNPCDFVSRAEVEGAIGKLSADPAVDASGSTCTYRVESANGTRTYPVSYTWEGGGRGMNMLKHGMSTFGGVMGMSGSSMLDTLHPTGEMGTMIGGLMKVVNGGSAHTAPGAAATTGFRTDTTLAGPWDQAMLFHGTQLMAVRHDALVDISLETADYERARALLTAIAKKL